MGTSAVVIVFPAAVPAPALPGATAAVRYHRMHGDHDRDSPTGRYRDSRGGNT